MHVHLLWLGLDNAVVERVLNGEWCISNNQLVMDTQAISCAALNQNVDVVLVRLYFYYRDGNAFSQ